MWKYLVALLVVLLSMGGLVAAQVPADMECTDCYANIVTQADTQTVDNVRIAFETILAPDPNVAIGNEGLSAGIIVTQPAVNPTDEDQFFIPAPFARIDQKMDQTVRKLGDPDVDIGTGAKGITWNKAIQAAWVANQGLKEFNGELVPEGQEYEKEGSYISQSTNQTTFNVYDYDSRDQAKVLNVDNKLAMIVDDMNAIINLNANANSTSTDSQASHGNITNAVGITIAGFDPATL
jgi:hypothetical protein